MTDFADIWTPDTIKTFLSGHASIAASEILDDLKSRWMDEGIYYSVMWMDVPMRQESINAKSSDANSSFMIYVKSTGYNDLVQRMSYIASIIEDNQGSGKFLPWKGFTPLAWNGDQFFEGSCTVAQNIYGVEHTYTT